MTGNQCCLIASETWQLNKLGLEDVPSYSSQSIPSQQNYIPYKGLNSSTLQTISEYKLLSTTAQGASYAGLCKGNTNRCTTQVLLLTTGVSLKPASCGIINPFRNCARSWSGSWTKRTLLCTWCKSHISQIAWIAAKNKCMLPRMIAQMEHLN